MGKKSLFESMGIQQASDRTASAQDYVNYKPTLRERFGFAKRAAANVRMREGTANYQTPRIVQKFKQDSPGVFQRVIRNIYPTIPMPSQQSRSGKGRVGRPAGVYKRGLPAKQYYKMLRQQAAQERLRFQQAQMQRMQQGQPVYQPQQYPPQYPPQQFQPPQPQYPQQYPSTNVRNIGRGTYGQAGSGAPFTPISQERKPVSNPNGAYYEDVDLMSGRRLLRRRPQPERWISE